MGEIKLFGIIKIGDGIRSEDHFFATMSVFTWLQIKMPLLYGRATESRSSPFF